MPATIDLISSIPVIPETGKRYLSVKADNVPLVSVIKVAVELGFTPELVKILYQFKTEIHILLWHGDISTTPSDINERVQRLENVINPDSIRHCWSKAC